MLKNNMKTWWLLVIAALLALSAAAAPAAAPAPPVLARCDPSALRRHVRFALELKASEPWSHVSLMLDVVNLSDEAVNLAGLRFTMSLAFRVLASKELSPPPESGTRAAATATVNTSSSSLAAAGGGGQRRNKREWLDSPGDEFKSFCLYGEMVRGSARDRGDGDGGGGGVLGETTEAALNAAVLFLGGGENVCDEYTRLHVDDDGIHFSFDFDDDDDDGDAAAVIPLCAGCNFGGGLYPLNSF